MNATPTSSIDIFVSVVLSYGLLAMGYVAIAGGLFWLLRGFDGKPKADQYAGHTSDRSD